MTQPDCPACDSAATLEMIAEGRHAGTIVHRVYCTCCGHSMTLDANGRVLSTTLERDMTGAVIGP